MEYVYYSPELDEIEVRSIKGIKYILIRHSFNWTSCHINNKPLITTRHIFYYIGVL